MMGITDARRITDLVNGLELDGFLTREVSPTDRRAHLLRPTEKMLAADREWLAAFHAPLALLYPDRSRPFRPRWRGTRPIRLPTGGSR